MPCQKVSRLEVDIRHLLVRCEGMMQDEVESKGWRIKQFVKSLDEMIADLRSISGNGDKDRIDEYSKRMSFLKRLLEVTKMNDTIEKSIAMETLAPSESISKSRTQEIFRKNMSSCENQIRKDLFEDSISLRHRTTFTEPSGSQELDSMLKYHQERHDKIADDMLSMTRSMKEQSQLAGKIIRDDTKVLEKASKYVDDNFHKLQGQSTRLQEFIVKSGWKCWLWIMMIIMVVVFINMVFFMRVARKKQ